MLVIGRFMPSTGAALHLKMESWQRVEDQEKI